jgi:N-[(2S)-2-amino-2-carboxyethyl]-L-glutamate dehydrogenase
MTDELSVPAFAVVPGRLVHEVVTGHERAVVDVVEKAYRLHGAGDTVNPPSYFLRFPRQPADRIIALPAVVGGDIELAGLKWISSFPGNIAGGLPRASAVLILNDLATGYPIACLESSIISAARTAASAALATRALSAGRPAPRRLGILGAGLIARYIHTYLSAAGFTFDEIAVHDTDRANADRLAGHLRDAAAGTPVRVDDKPEDLIRGSDLIVFATTAARPHIGDPGWFGHHPLVLHVSLRDLDPDVITAGVNVVDDVEHCLKADTSVHLVEQATGRRDHIAATLYDALTGAFSAPPDRTVIFSPFGLGVLDIAVAWHVHRRLTAQGRLTPVAGFFHELDRYGTGTTR